MSTATSVEIYRWDAPQSDGKSDGTKVASNSREKFTVRPIPRLTVSSGRKPSIHAGYRAIAGWSRADGKSLRSQAIRRTGWPRFVIRCARQCEGRGRDNLPLVDLWNYIINGGLSERRSTRCDRRQ
jgi:hypothetical protein